VRLLVTLSQEIGEDIVYSDIAIISISYLVYRVDASTAPAIYCFN
jgi:hypothetical protein